MEIKITSYRAQDIVAKLRAATKSSVKKSMKEVGKIYKTFTIKRFRSQPPEWLPKKRDNGKPILVDTGRLRRDVGQLKVKVDGTTVTASVKTPYAPFHQFGTSRMPKRTILIKPPKAILNKMRETLRKELTKILK